MRGKKMSKLSRLEMEVMEPLWILKEATIRQILDNISVVKKPEYTTAQTIINRLEEKGVVARVKMIGNAHLYKPMISKKSAIGKLVDDFIDILGGSVEPMMSHLVDARKISLEEIKNIEALLDRARKRKKK